MQRFLFYYILLSSLVVGQSGAASTPMVWWVDLKNGNDNWAGSTEVTAFKTVHKILESNSWNSGDTIKVKPSLASDGSLSYYDFKNDEINLNTSNNFVLIGTGGADVTIFDAGSERGGGNRHFYFDDGQSSSTVIKGITFKNGKNEDYGQGGGSISIYHSDPQFISCKWESNAAYDDKRGGAIYVNGSSTPLFDGCEFKNNFQTFDDNTYSGGGGAIYFQSADNTTYFDKIITVKNSIFSGNYVYNYESTQGGAIYSQRQIELTNSVFYDNYSKVKDGPDSDTYAESFGGAVYFDVRYWAGSSWIGGAGKIVNCTFDNNWVDFEGGSSSNYNMYGGTIAYGRWESNLTSKFYMFNSIITRNGFRMDGSEYVESANSQRMRNSIVGAGNTDTYKATIDYSMIEGNSNMTTVGDYVYDVSPVFTDTSANNYTLSDKSPLIGAGVSNWSDEGLFAPTVDILGSTRPNPSGSNPDMGAYENSNSSSTAPLPVSGLTGQRATASAILSWSKNTVSLSSSTEASNIEYQIYKNGTNVGQTTTTTYTATGLTNGTSYSFTVSAKNTSTGVEGAQSEAKTVTPRYLGPKWHVTTTSGKSLSDTTNNYLVGSTSAPINHLTNAIEIAAAGDTIVMMKGTHTGSNNRGINFDGNKKQLVIMGEDGDDPWSTIIDAGGRDRHFTFDSGEDTTYQIIGLTLQNGKHTSGQGGGSVLIKNQSSAFFKKVIFKQNKSTSDDWATGGAVYVENSYGLFYDCEFIENENDITGNTNDQQARGGAVRINSSYNEKISTFLRCEFSDNIVKANGEAYGGALAIYEGGADIINCVFSNNKTLSAVGGQSGNRTSSGGAIHIRSTSYWNNQGTEFTNNIKIINNTLYGNAATSEISNSNTYAGGIALGTGGKTKVTFFNNILWDNTAGDGSDQSRNELHTSSDPNSRIYVDYNLIKNLTSNQNYNTFGDYNISVDPAFSDISKSDFELTDESEAIGAGASSFEGVSAPTTDYSGNIRPNPAGSNPDMGAYENSLAKSPYPKQVQNLSAVGGSGQVTLNWDAVADADSAYKVYQHTSAFAVAATYYVGATSAKTSPHETTYTITGLDNATRYYLRVTAVSKLGYEGTASATLDITPKFSGPVWWVATDGSDTNEGSKTSPFISFDHAMHEANEGDTIKIKPGTYTGSKNRDLDSEGKNLVIMSQYPTTWDSVIIDAEKQNRHFDFNNKSGTISVSKTKLIGLTLKNGEVGGNTNSAGPDGGSVKLQDGTAVRFEKIYFLNNTIINNSSTASAGAVWMGTPGSIFYNCRFELNRSLLSGNGDAQATGAIGIDDWGAYQGDTYKGVYTLIDGCEFISNLGRQEGGAINARHNTVIQNSLFYKNRAYKDGNNASGGAIATMARVEGDGGSNYDTYLHVINCTFVENSAESQGGAIQYGGSNGPIIFNSIFMNNRKNDPDGSGQGELNDFMGGPENNKFKVNNVRVDESTVASTDRVEWGNNIYFDPPAFTDTTKENFTLTSASTLIGAGTTSFEGVSSPTKDIIGNTRPNPSGSSPDLGAYENSLGISPFPKQVKNVTATVGSQSVSLSWDANTETDLAKYVIYSSTVKGFTPAKEDSVGETTATVYNVTGLTNNTEYHFRVAAINTVGYRGSFSQELSAMPQYLGPTWWVSNDGNDINDGSEFLPLNSLFEAFRRVNSGDTIAIKAGTYMGDANAGFIDDQIFQQQDGSPKPSMELTIKGVTGDPGDVVFDGQNSGKQRFFIFQRRDPYNDKIRIENITFQNGFHNGDTNDSPAGGGAIHFIAAHTELEFENVIFKKNQAHQADNHSGGGAVMISVAQGKKPPMFINCRFIDNRVQPKDGSGNDSAMGGAVCIQPGWEGPGGDSFSQPAVIFDQCYFESNQAHSSNTSNGWRTGSAIQSQANIIIRNSVFVNNHFGGGGESNDATVDLQPQYNSDDGSSRYSGRAILINNTFHDNQGRKIIAFQSSDHESARLFLYSNIFSEYADEGVEVYKGSTGVEFHAGSNLFDQANNNYMLQQDIEIVDGGGDIIGDPRFKGEAIKNFELTPSSPAIDAGINSLPPGSNDELGGGNAPIFDIRGYYRVGTPDLGAYEFGASKYILTMVDDITEDKDTTFVDLSQELKITVTTGDIDGNLVSSNETMTWNVFPNQKYVKYVSGDENTEGGDASATFEVTSQTRGKGFRFRVEAGVGDAFMRSGMYVIEELVTGAPPPVLSLSISPSDWTSDPNFTLSWETPIWAAQRDLIGAVVEVTDGISIYNQYMGFPSGDTLTNYSFTAPEAGQYDASLWLIDELGNEDKDSSRTVTALFDDVPPEEFDLHWPNDYVDESGNSHQTYTSDVPRFDWHAKDDYPSGVKEWRLFLNNSFNYAYTWSDVTDDDNDNRWVDHATTPLSDGYYHWYVQAVDMAGNVTHSSDTAYFGVDLSPPNITHSNPLTIVDENTTSPSINVTFSDAASGVLWGRLNYRRSGSGGGFVAVDLLTGPINIPGSDIKAEGLEYYIETEDNVGNRGYWPSDTTFHSVRVRGESNVTTADRWSSGIPGGTDSTNYLFFSIPFEVSGAKSAITSVMGPPDEFNYRLYAYNNGWQENPSSVTMGNAYFFIFDPDKYPDNPNLSFDFGEGVSTPTDPPYGVNISSGQWKFFGSPYNFNVSLDNVYTEDGTNVRDAGSIYTWGGSWSSVSTLQPWRGYIYKSGGATKLNIDGRGSNFGKLAKAFDPDNVAMDAAEWIVNIIATSGNARDELNAVGVRHMAKDGYDKLDEFEPPAVPGDVVLRIDNRDREESPDLYAVDIRKPNEKGHYWDLQVFTPTNGNRTYITFDGLGYIPQEYDVFLINKTTQQAKNLEWESSYRFANTGSDRYLQQDLRLVIGTKDFVNENNAGVNLYPDAFTLSQNYPNPFNPQTSIMISLEEDAQVDLVIYNLLGEQVTRLATNENRPAGYYTFIWNGTNDVGRKVSTGVYFYHAMIKNSQGRVVLNKTRKMIFLK